MTCSWSGCRSNQIDDDDDEDDDYEDDEVFIPLFFFSVQSIFLESSRVSPYRKRSSGFCPVRKGELILACLFLTGFFYD